MSDVFQRLTLKGTPFNISQPASDLLIAELKSSLQNNDSSIADPVSMTSKDVRNKPVLKKFMSHCCPVRKYLFMIKKCGQVPCPEGICTPSRLPQEKFLTPFIPYQVINYTFCKYWYLQVWVIKICKIIIQTKKNCKTFIV